MCLGVPGRVLAVDGLVARVDFWGVAREIRLDVVDAPVAPGDWVLNHVGFAIRRIPEEQIGETLAFFDALLAQDGAGDPMGDELRAELAAAPREGGDG